MNGKSALGVLLVIVGGIAVLNFIGIHFGAIFGFLLPFILIGSRYCRLDEQQEMDWRHTYRNRRDDGSWQARRRYPAASGNRLDCSRSEPLQEG